MDKNDNTKLARLGAKPEGFSFKSFADKAQQIADNAKDKAKEFGELAAQFSGSVTDTVGDIIQVAGNNLGRKATVALLTTAILLSTGCSVQSPFKPLENDHGEIGFWGMGNAKERQDISIPSKLTKHYIEQGVSPDEIKGAVNNAMKEFQQFRKTMESAENRSTIKGRTYAEELTLGKYSHKFCEEDNCKDLAKSIQASESSLNK